MRLKQNKLTCGVITPMEINDDTTALRVSVKTGTLLKLSNSSDSEEDDYFLKFVGDGGDDGPGRWEETTAPGVYHI